jgi:hypothetical protein
MIKGFDEYLYPYRTFKIVPLNLKGWNFKRVKPGKCAAAVSMRNSS